MQAAPTDAAGAQDDERAELVTLGVRGLFESVLPAARALRGSVGHRRFGV